MQKHCKSDKTFSRQSYDLAVSEYSQSTYNEISEEISTLFDEKCMNQIERIIQDLGINFTSNQFATSAKKFNLVDPELILDGMYRVGIVGNNFIYNQNPKWRFFYRRDQNPDRSKPFIVHRALHDALGIKGRFSEAVLHGAVY